MTYRKSRSQSNKEAFHQLREHGWRYKRSFIVLAALVQQLNAGEESQISEHDVVKALQHELEELGFDTERMNEADQKLLNRLSIKRL